MHMKKILVPFLGAVYQPELADFALLLSTRSRVHLTAVFVPDQDYDRPWAPDEARRRGIAEFGQLSVGVDAGKIAGRGKARLRRFCEENEIDYTIRQEDPEFPVRSVVRETRFADLLLLSSVRLFGTMGDGQERVPVRELLYGSECPVMLLPPIPRLPGELVFAYDGSASATHAIRQFAYLFPDLTRLRTTLVFLYDKDNAELPDESFIRELGSRHFKHFRVLRLSRRSDDFYDTWIRLMDNPWLICGAAGRSEGSLYPPESFADRMMRAHGVPAFIVQT
jgi:hypothetical protein